MSECAPQRVLGCIEEVLESVACPVAVAVVVVEAATAVARVVGKRQWCGW